jgi:hypothetical protein
LDKILLNDILQFDETEIPNIRIKFNITDGDKNPLELYKANPDDVNIEWLLWHDKRRYFRKGQIAICFLRIDTDAWLLTTIKEITKELEIDSSQGGVGYEAEDVAKYQKFFGRLVVKYHNTNKNMGRTYQSVMNELEILEILNDKFTGNDFPGYENVRLSYSELKSIVERQPADWIAALQNQKAVYLITDTNTGKHYVGSATSQTGMLLQRWSNYVSNGHGGNVELRELVKTKGFDYIKKYFQYAILENYNARMDDDYILKRESWWKETLMTRDFGYNDN